MKLSDIYEEFKHVAEVLERTEPDLELRKKMIKAAGRYAIRMLDYVDFDQLPTCISLTAEESKQYTEDPELPATEKIHVFGRDVIIYLDDYGQCYSIKLDDEYFGLGTYNSDISFDIVFLTFEDIIKTISEQGVKSQLEFECGLVGEK